MLKATLLKAAGSHERPAKVINIASVDGIFVNPTETYSYAASKAGLIHLTKRMALQLAPEHIAEFIIGDRQHHLVAVGQVRQELRRRDLRRG